MDHLAYFQGLYEAFNRRDMDGVLAFMVDDVDWPNAWKGGRLTGRQAVRDYWTAQWAEIDPHVEPLAVTERPDGRVAVTVRQVVRSADGQLLGDGQVVHVYDLEDDLIRRMNVEEPDR
jgi:hypothetical protein